MSGLILRRALLLGLVAAAVLAGCGSNEAPGGSATSTETETQAATSTLDPGNCKGGETAPFTVEELLQGMRSAGYDMYVDPRCSPRVASWAISNTSALIPELPADAYQKARAREGAIGCTLFGETGGTGGTVTKQQIEGKDYATLSVLNVSCDITPDPAKKAEQIDRLEKTLNELAADQR